MGFVEFLAYIRHLGKNALVFFPSKTDLIFIADKGGNATDEMLSERLENLENYIGFNILSGGNQYTKETPFSPTAASWTQSMAKCYLEFGRAYTFSFLTEGEYNIPMKGSLSLVKSGTAPSSNTEILIQNTKFTFVPPQTGKYNLYNYSPTEISKKFWDMKIELGTRATMYVPNLDYVRGLTG